MTTSKRPQRPIVIPRPSNLDSLPSLPAGQVWRQIPPNEDYISDPEWYDPLGRDQLEQNKIWEMTDSPAEQTGAVLGLLDRFPKRGLTMLFHSAVHGNLHLVRALLRAGVPPHCRPPPSAGDDDGRSIDDETNDALVPIHAAAFHGHVQCVKALVEEGGVDPDIADGTGTPVMRAHMAPHMGVIRYLLSTGRVDLRRRHVSGGRERHPLEWILRNGNTESATLLAETLWEQEQSEVVVPDEAIHAAADGGVVGNMQLAFKAAGYPDPQDAIITLSERQRAVLLRAAVYSAQSAHLDTLKLIIQYLDRDKTPDKPFAAIVPQSEDDKEAFRMGLIKAATEKTPEAFDFIFDILSRSTLYKEEERMEDLVDSLSRATRRHRSAMVSHLTEKYQARAEAPNQTEISGFASLSV